MVYRIYVEKKKGLDNEAVALKSDLASLFGISGLEKLRIINRYDVEGLDADLFKYAVGTVFSEPQLDTATDEINFCGAEAVFAVEYLPGQFDQRADSAAQCIQIISQSERPIVRTARVYVLNGKLSQTDIDTVKKYVINPVECREASLEKPETLDMSHAAPAETEVLNGFLTLPDDELKSFADRKGLAMDHDDILFCRDYFRKENRCPTMTEIRMIDTYWSDHCRHTTFLTTLDSVTFDDSEIQNTYLEYLDARRETARSKPVNLMDVATIAVRLLKKRGLLPRLDESEEINACTVKIDVTVNGEKEKWLLLFKNETHNHPTEIEPFGGAATCIGGAIRDPLSGRAYVYAAMRVTGAGDPLTPVGETLKGKLPQRKIVTTAAAGYSSYGNQIGLATGIVDEIYHSGYVAKRMEIGAVIGAVPEENVRRECPEEGDIVILLGGRTGRDGCGGATGSSKSHTLESLSSCGAEVQKGNAPEERKLQRLFRNKEASLLIKRCNDFGAGGVSVAIGELADGLEIDLNKVPKKYDGLDGTELAISESQERMAVVVEKADTARFMELAHSENLEATAVAVVTKEPRLKMKWNGKYIVDISRDFLNSNGAEKHICPHITKPEGFARAIPHDFEKGMRDTASDLNICSKQGLSERFDSTIGAGTVLMPFGGKYQMTPIQAMVNKISVERGDTDDCSLMAWGYNPFITEKSPYHGAYTAVVESICKLAAVGASFENTYLTFQEFFERPNSDKNRWGKPLAALLGAFKAQKDFGIGAIGGKDSMSGSFEKIDVPPTLVSFAVTTAKTGDIISPEFKKANSTVVLIKPKYNGNIPDADSLKTILAKVHALIAEGKVASAYTVTAGGIAEAVMKMCFGNRIGFRFADGVTLSDIFGYQYGSFVLEMTEAADCGTVLGCTSSTESIVFGDESVTLEALEADYINKLEPIYKTKVAKAEEVERFTYLANKYPAPAFISAKPTVLIPVFPGTNCEYDSAKAVERAGARAAIFVVKNLSAQDIADSVDYFSKRLTQSQMVFIPGGFSGGDEPDGSGKFITAFFRNGKVKQELTALLDDRMGLMCGICNGFQALIKLGLVPYGKVIDTDAACPTLTFNTIGRHQSKLVRTRVASNKSAWLSMTEPDEVYTVPVSHGEGRFIADDSVIRKLAENGQIATQYTDLNGNPTMDIRFNPNGSAYAIEGITSPDGRVFGKMGHTERTGSGLYKNVNGVYDMHIFEAAVKYFK